jgi:DNA-binding NarL/FixJ family response regulator
MLREGLKSLIQLEPDMEIVGEASNGHDTLTVAMQNQAQVVIMDVSMPGLNGIETTRKLVKARPACKIVALSGHSDPQLVREMLQAGAAAYVLKSTAYEDLVRAIRSVQEGKKYLSADIATTLVDEYLSLTAAPDNAAFAILSEREREVLQLIAEGCSTKEVAATLRLNRKTIDGVRSSLMRKLNLHTVAELTKYAIKAKITAA